MRSGLPPLAPAALRKTMQEMYEGGASFDAIAAALNRRGERALKGGRWYAASVRLCLLRAAASPTNESSQRSSPC